MRARHGVSCVTWIHGLLGSTNLALLPFFFWELASWCKQAQSVFFSFPPSPCFSFFACLQQAFNLELLEVQALNLKTWFVSVWLQMALYQLQPLRHGGHVCLFCCRWASGAFQSEEFDADTDTVSNTKAYCSHYLLPCSFMFSLFFFGAFHDWKFGFHASK